MIAVTPQQTLRMADKAGKPETDRGQELDGRPDPKAVRHFCDVAVRLVDWMREQGWLDEEPREPQAAFGRRRA
jgi:hypothetical protein